MPDLLFLAHRIPYPPNKGDKIRAWHLLEHLSRRYRVHLGAFVDDADDWRHVDKLKQVCASTQLLAVDPRWGKLRALTGLATGEPLTLPFYRSPEMQRWVDARLAEGVAGVVCYSSAMARFVMDARATRRIMDFVDIDSDKWRQYAPTKPWPLSWLYRREGERLLAWERRVAAEFDAGLFVSDAEASDFRRLAPESAGKISHFSNGVDAAYFDPDLPHPNPFPEGTRALVFTGAMDYWPNVDAVTWFAREVLPLFRQDHPDAVFYVVGSRPSNEVVALASEHVVVTGRVDDVRPYLAHAAMAVAPLRIARGIQNKVLEAMAMAKTVVATPQALEGITAHIGEEILCAETPRDFVAELERGLGGSNHGQAARRRVLADYSWAASLARVDQWLQDKASA